MKNVDGAGTNVEGVIQAIGRMPRPTAPREFRARLRAQFVRGTMPDRDRGASLRRSAMPWRVPAAAAGTVVVLSLVVSLLNAGSAWRVTGWMGTGDVLVDGRTVPLDVMRGLRLRAGTVLEVPADLQLDVDLPGIARLQIAGGSRVAVPGSPGRWIARSVSAPFERGEIRVSTGPAFRGSRLTIVTPEMRAGVTGTTFAVIRNRDGSCVCVLDGSVVMAGGAATDTVHSGLRRSVFRDGRPPLVEPILPMETMKLTMLREQAEQTLGR